MSTRIGLTPTPSPRLITPASRCAIGAALIRAGGMAVPASGTSPWSTAANCILAFPFVIETTTTFYKAFWVNGTSVGGATEAGIWDANYNKVVTTGSVANSGSSSVPQVASITTTKLSGGLYYAGIAHNATTTGRFFRWTCTAAGFYESFGCWREAGITLGSLPTTSTPGTITEVGFPLFGLITHTGFDL